MKVAAKWGPALQRAGELATYAVVIGMPIGAGLAVAWWAWWA